MKSQDVQRHEFLQANRQVAETSEKVQTGSEPIRSSLDLLRSFDRMAIWVYRQRDRQVFSESEKSEFEADLATQAFQLNLLAGDRPQKSDLSFRELYRLIWIENIDVFWATLLAFCVSTVLGGLIGLYHTEYSNLLIGQQMMETILDREAWFERLQENPAMGAFEIAVNNIKVSIFAFLGGAVFGLGSIYILLFNGLMIGAVFGYCMKNGFHDRLTDFIATHGFLELTVIIAAAFAGIVMGRGIWRGLIEDRRNWVARLSETAYEAQILAMGIIPWLLLAGLMEGFVSPFPTLSTIQKAMLGITLTLIFLAYTFMPEFKFGNSGSRAKSGGRT